MDFLPRVNLMGSRHTLHTETDCQKPPGMDSDADLESPRWMRMMTDPDMPSQGGYWGQIFSRPAVRYAGQPSQSGFFASSNLNGKALSSRDVSLSDPYKDELEPYFNSNSGDSFTSSIQSYKDKRNTRRRNTIFLVLLLVGLLGVIAGITAATLWSIIGQQNGAVSGRLENPLAGGANTGGGATSTVGMVTESTTVLPSTESDSRIGNIIDGTGLASTITGQGTSLGSTHVSSSAPATSGVDATLPVSSVNGLSTSPVQSQDVTGQHSSDHMAGRNTLASSIPNIYQSHSLDSQTSSQIRLTLQSPSSVNSDTYIVSHTSSPHSFHNLPSTQSQHIHMSPTATITLPMHNTLLAVTHPVPFTNIHLTSSLRDPIEGLGGLTGSSVDISVHSRSVETASLAPSNTLTSGADASASLDASRGSDAAGSGTDSSSTVVSGSGGSGEPATLAPSNTIGFEASDISGGSSDSNIRAGGSVGSTAVVLDGSSTLFPSNSLGFSGDVTSALGGSASPDAGGSRTGWSSGTLAPSNTLVSGADASSGVRESSGFSASGIESGGRSGTATLSASNVLGFGGDASAALGGSGESTGGSSTVGSGAGVSSTVGSGAGASSTVGSGTGGYSTVGSGAGVFSTVGSGTGGSSMVSSGTGGSIMVGSGTGGSSTVGSGTGGSSTVPISVGGSGGTATMAPSHTVADSSATIDSSITSSVVKSGAFVSDGTSTLLPSDTRSFGDYASSSLGGSSASNESGNVISGSDVTATLIPSNTLGNGGDATSAVGELSGLSASGSGSGGSGASGSVTLETGGTVTLTPSNTLGFGSDTSSGVGGSSGFSAGGSGETATLIPSNTISFEVDTSSAVGGSSGYSASSSVSLGSGERATLTPSNTVSSEDDASSGVGGSSGFSAGESGGTATLTPSNTLSSGVDASSGVGGSSGFSAGESGGTATLTPSNTLSSEVDASSGVGGSSGFSAGESGGTATLTPSNTLSSGVDASSGVGGSSGFSAGESGGTATLTPSNTLSSGVDASSGVGGSSGFSAGESGGKVTLAPSNTVSSEVDASSGVGGSSGFSVASSGSETVDGSKSSGTATVSPSHSLGIERDANAGLGGMAGSIVGGTGSGGDGSVVNSTVISTTGSFGAASIVWSGEGHGYSSESGGGNMLYPTTLTSLPDSYTPTEQTLSVLDNTLTAFVFTPGSVSGSLGSGSADGSAGSDTGTRTVASDHLHGSASNTLVLNSLSVGTVNTLPVSAVTHSDLLGGTESIAGSASSVYSDSASISRNDDTSLDESYLSSFQTMTVGDPSAIASASPSSQLDASLSASSGVDNASEFGQRNSLISQTASVSATGWLDSQTGNIGASVTHSGTEEYTHSPTLGAQDTSSSLGGTVEGLTSSAVLSTAVNSGHGVTQSLGASSMNSNSPLLLPSSQPISGLAMASTVFDSATATPLIGSGATAVTSGVGSDATAVTSGVGSGATAVTSGVGSGATAVTSGVGSDATAVTSGVGSGATAVTSGVGSGVTAVTSGVGSGATAVTSGVGSGGPAVTSGVGFETISAHVQTGSLVNTAILSNGVTDSLMTSSQAFTGSTDINTDDTITPNTQPTDSIPYPTHTISINDASVYDASDRSMSTGQGAVGVTNVDTMIATVTISDSGLVSVWTSTVTGAATTTAASASMGDLMSLSSSMATAPVDGNSMNVISNTLSRSVVASSLLDSMNSIPLMSSNSVLDSMNLGSSSSLLNSMNLGSSSTVLDSMNLGSSSTVLDSMNLGSSSTVLDSMNLGSSSTVLDSMNVGSSSTVLDSMNIGSSSTVLDSMNLGSSSTVLDSMNVISSSTVLDSMNIGSSSTVLDSMNLGSSSTVLDSMNLGSSSTVLDSMNVGSSSTVLDSMNLGSSSTVLDSMNLGSSSSLLDSMYLGSSSSLLDSMNIMPSSTVTDTYIASSSAQEGTPSVATYSDGQTIDNSMQSSVVASMTGISALDGVSSVGSMDSSVLASMSGLNLLLSISLKESVHASMAPSTVQTSMVVTSETIGVVISSVDGSMVTMATGHTQTSMLRPSASISTAYNSMDGSTVTMATGNAQASMVDASNTVSSSMNGSMATQTGLVDAAASTPFNSQDVSMITMVTGDGQTSMVGGGMTSTTSVDTQTSMIDPSSTLATALNGMDGSATTTPGAASPGESGTTRLTTPVNMATSLEGGSVVNSMMGSSTMGFADVTASTDTMPTSAADGINSAITSLASDSSVPSDGVSTSTGILPSTVAASTEGVTTSATGGSIQASSATGTIAPSSTLAEEASSAVVSTTPTTTSVTTTSQTTTTTTTTTTRAPVITMANPPALLHTETSVSCTLQGEGWSLVGFFQLFEGNYRAIAGFTADNNDNVFLSHGLSSSRYNDTNTTTFVITFDNVTCEQDTTYLCAASFPTTNIDDRGRLQVTLPHEPPVVTYPGDIQNSTQVTLTCEAIVITTDGDLYWAIKRPGETTFARKDFADDTRTETQGSCTKTITHTLTTTFDMSYNGTEIRCQSSNPDDVSSANTLLIVPSNLCDSYPANSLVTHPYDCNKYITCIPGARLTQRCPGSLCFDQDIQQCVENTNSQGSASDDPYSCDGKTNGAYIPWRGSCTKYAWCVNGQPIEQTCATGTYYTQFVGPCTFDRASAFCDESQLV